MKQMDEITREKLRERFLMDLGNYIRIKREKKGATGKDVGTFIGLDKSTVSKYENGEMDMPISKIQLLSLACDFSLSECFSELDDKRLVEEFKDIIKINRIRYQRDREIEKIELIGRKLKARVYELDGVRIEEPVVSKPAKGPSYRRKLMMGEIRFDDIQPFSEEELQEYLVRSDNAELAELLMGTGQIIQVIGESGGKERLKDMLADLVVEKAIVQKIISADDYDAKRLYMYYLQLLNDK